MAQIEMKPAASGKTKRRVHHSPVIDMTPMVDLGFLLITFFIFTTTLSQKTSTALIMPKEGGEGMALAESKALTVVLGDHNQVFAYEGKWEEAVRNHQLIQTNYTEQAGIGKLIRDKQQRLQKEEGNKGRDGLMLLIKPTTQSSYQNLVAALDETTINGVKKYAVVEPTPEEKIYSATAPNP